MNTADTSDPGRAGHRGVLFAMCLSLVLVIASVTALNMALPDLAVDLNASTTDLTWIADAYTVALAALVLPIGALGDRIGRRNVLVAGNLVFGAAALAASFADSTDTLIACRALMGIGAAMIMPGTLSTITAAFPPGQRARGVATWSGFAAAGAVIGLLVAGALLQVWSWPSIFVASSVTAVISAASAVALAPNTRDQHTQPRDVLGALLKATAIGTLVFGIIEGNERGWTEPIVVAAGAVSILSFVGYAAIGLRSQAPMLDPRLFGMRGFRAGAVTVLVQFMAVFGFFFVGIQYLLLILGYSPLRSAVALVPVALVVLPVSIFTARLVERVSVRVVMPAGLFALLLGLFWISRLSVDSGYAPFLGGLLVAGVGIGLTSSTGTSAITASLPPGRQGVASAMNDATREVGSAVGIALMGSVFGTFYANNLPSLAALPNSAQLAVESSPAGGLSVAERIGGTSGSELAEVVKAAFMDGLSASLTVVCAVLLVAVVGTALRAPGKALA